jgi:hypothetical protein
MTELLDADVKSLEQLDVENPLQATTTSSDFELAMKAMESRLEKRITDEVKRADASLRKAIRAAVPDVDEKGTGTGEIANLRAEMKQMSTAQTAGLAFVWATMIIVCIVVVT